MDGSVTDDFKKNIMPDSFPCLIVTCAKIKIFIFR
jgi:hypothetical protein